MTDNAFQVGDRVIDTLTNQPCTIIDIAGQDWALPDFVKVQFDSGSLVWAWSESLIFDKGRQNMMTDKQLHEKALELYKRLGGSESEDARIVRGLWERWQGCKEICKETEDETIEKLRKEMTELLNEIKKANCDRGNNQ